MNRTKCSSNMKPFTKLRTQDKNYVYVFVIKDLPAERQNYPRPLFLSLQSKYRNTIQGNALLIRYPNG